MAWSLGYPKHSMASDYYIYPESMVRALETKRECTDGQPISTGSVQGLHF